MDEHRRAVRRSRRPVKVHERIAAVLDRLGIERAHFASCLAGELVPLLAARPGLVASLALVNPNRLERNELATLGARLLMLTGSAGLPAGVVEAARPSLPAARVVRFPAYHTAAWSDLVAERRDAVVEAMLAHAGAGETQRGARTLTGGVEGEVAGVTYRVRGTGPALVLLPLALAPSQWEPAVDALAERFAVVVLGGAWLGMIAMLESRGSERGYQRAVGEVLEEAAPAPGETILEIGCGSGVLARWIAERTDRRNPIVATDLNPFFLREAAALAEQHGLRDAVSFREANAESLPFEDDSIDVVFSSTVMEECDAERMLAEMIRVARPGGRVAVIVRAIDMPSVCTVPAGAAVRAKLEAPYRSVAPRGCADASLYDRFAASPLTDCRFFPHLLTLRDPDGAAWAYREPYYLAQFTPAEAEDWHDAKARAIAEGTFVFASGLHCAVGTKLRA